MAKAHRLYLLRHAKSSWDDPGMADAERPLAPRGCKAAKSLKRYFRDERLGVDLVLCSPAERTRQTWAIVSGGLDGDAEVRFLPAIYEASTDALLGIVQGTDESATSVLLIGHNPGLAELADALVADGDPDAVDRLRDGYPTGALAALSVPPAWAKTRHHSGFLDRFVRPRDLA